MQHYLFLQTYLLVLFRATIDCRPLAFFSRLCFLFGSISTIYARHGRRFDSEDDRERSESACMYVCMYDCMYVGSDGVSVGLTGWMDGWMGRWMDGVVVVRPIVVVGSWHGETYRRCCVVLLFRGVAGIR